LTLVTSDSPGLQVQTPNGNWEDVPYVPGGIQVNIGDMMALWTNDKWISTMHRVLPPGNTAQRRMALTFFLTANYDTLIEPLATCCDSTHPAQYAPITAWDHLVAKLRRQFSHDGNSMEDSSGQAAQL
jgi:isopenicillin N synthase-like dioxygenase